MYRNFEEIPENDTQDRMKFLAKLVPTSGLDGYFTSDGSIVEISCITLTTGDLRFYVKFQKKIDLGFITGKFFVEDEGIDIAEIVLGGADFSQDITHEYDVDQILCGSFTPLEFVVDEPRKTIRSKSARLKRIQEILMENFGVAQFPKGKSRAGSINIMGIAHGGQCLLSIWTSGDVCVRLENSQTGQYTAAIIEMDGEMNGMITNESDGSSKEKRILDLALATFQTDVQPKKILKSEPSPSTKGIIADISNKVATFWRNL